jgi:formate dehydrogenase iron-sulfur subunit
MPKTIFIDTTRCTACRGCQVACKEWHGHKAVPTKQRGTHQNPPDLTPFNFKLVRFNEYKIKDKVQWLFFPEQCRHCLEPGCKAGADSVMEGAILQDAKTGAVVFTEKLATFTKEQAEDVKAMCPYNVPRYDEEAKRLTKCDMCLDRQEAGIPPACVKTCCTGTMNYGEREDMLKLANERLALLKPKYPQAQLLDPNDLNVIYLVTEPRKMYHEFAERQVKPLTRRAMFAKLVRPLGRMAG